MMHSRPSGLSEGLRLCLRRGLDHEFGQLAGRCLLWKDDSQDASHGVLRVSKEGIHCRKVVDFESQKGLILDVSNGIFMKNTRFPGLPCMSPPAFPRRVPAPSVNSCVVTGLSAHGPTCFSTFRPTEQQKQHQWGSWYLHFELAQGSWYLFTKQGIRFLAEPCTDHSFPYHY